MVPEFIKTSVYVIGSTVLHGATILAIAFSPSLMQIGSLSGFGEDPVAAPQTGDGVEIVEINVAPTEKVKPTENKDDFVIVKEEPVKKQPVKKEAPKKKQVENKVEKVAAANVEAKLPEKVEAPKEDLTVETIPKSEVLKELAVDDSKEEINTEDKVEEVQQVKNEELMPDKNPEASAEDTRMLEAVAAADAAAGANQEIDNEIAEQLDATPSQEDIAAEMDTLPKGAEETSEVANSNTEGAALPEKAAAATAAASALPQKGAEQGPAKSDGTKMAKQNFLQLRQQPGNQPPTYPERARMQRQEGSGQLKYFVTKDGRVTDLVLTKSTGHSDLDVAAMNSFRKFKFVPGQEGYTVHNFRFALKGKELPARGRLRTTLTKPAVQ